MYEGPSEAAQSAVKWALTRSEISLYSSANCHSGDSKNATVLQAIWVYADNIQSNEQACNTMLGLRLVRSCIGFTPSVITDSDGDYLITIFGTCTVQHAKYCGLMQLVSIGYAYVQALYMCHVCIPSHICQNIRSANLNHSN